MFLEVKVMTLNIWGLPKVLSKHKTERVHAIGEAISESNFDIVCLQEVWDTNDYEIIKLRVTDILPYSHYFFSGVTGSGLCIFSKWPIVEVIFFQWTLNGYMHKIQHGDWFGGKGVGLVKIDAQGFSLNFYTAHLHARYDRKNDAYLAHRVVQAFDTSSFVRLTSDSADLSIFAGDLNTEPGELCQKLLQHIPNFQDAYNSRVSEDTWGTNECLRNTFSTKEQIRVNPVGCRIDYVLYKGGKNSEAESLSYCLPLESNVPEKDFSYSDHEAVEAVIRVASTRNEANTVGQKLHVTGDIEEAIVICLNALKKVKTNSLCYLMYSTVLFLVILITHFTSLVDDYPKTVSISTCLLTGFMCYTVIMGTLWYKIETNALRGAVSRMKIALSQEM